MTLADFSELNLHVPELLNERQESVIVELSKRLTDADRIENVCGTIDEALEKGGRLFPSNQLQVISPGICQRATANRVPHVL
ncbi:MAG TPA: hypothetical protein VLZ12_15930 [Verrucomicrobiae bacterium]|nr:hypothetical protein [Verrucomicrobiae bacterium]